MLVAAFLAGAGGASAETITLRSGQAAVGEEDPTCTMSAGFPTLALSTMAFTDVDFAGALAGPPARIVAAHQSWVPSLSCDPLPKWIGVNLARTPRSTLFGCEFAVEACCIESATLTVCYAADDYLGDYPAGPNQAGVYINNAPVVPMIGGGSFAAETSTGPVDITDMLHCGTNSFFMYDRDVGSFVSGVIFSATIEITECTVHTEMTTWSRVKALYR
jgi:hypothetical protein